MTSMARPTSSPIANSSFSQTNPKPQATVYTNPGRGPQENVQAGGVDWFGSLRPASAPKTSSAPKTTGSSYQAYAQQGQPQTGGPLPPARQPQTGGPLILPEDVPQGEKGVGVTYPQRQPQTGGAQSIPTQSQGTPYQAYAKPGFEQVGEVGTAVMRDWYNPKTGQTTQTSSGNYRPVEGSGWVSGKPTQGRADGPVATIRQPSQTVTGDWQGSYAAAPASQRPAPFQMGAAQTPWGQSMDPFAERDAFINQLNQQRMQNQIAFNSGGMTDPTAGMTPGLNYQQAMQQAGLGGGAPSMAANYGDSMISRLNQAFGGQGDPFAFANQQGYYQPQSPAMTQQAQASIPSQGTLPSWAVGSPLDQPPGAMNWGDWARIQQQQAMQDQGPGREVVYSDGTRSWIKDPQATPPRPYTPPAYSPVSTVGTPPPPPSGPANPYGAPVTDRPAPPPQVPQAKDQNRAKFLQDRAYGRIDSPTATYDSYVKTTLDNVTGQVLNSPAGVEMYNHYQSADPAKRMAAAERLKSLIYDRALQQGVAPGDEWFSKKTGKSAAGGRDQYFNEAMAKHSAKQSPAGKAQSIQPPSQGTSLGSRLNEWAAAGKPGNPEIQLMQIGNSRIDGTGFGSITEAAAYDRWLSSQGVRQPTQGVTPGYGTPPQGQPQMDAKTGQFWKDYLSSPRVKDWAMNTEGPAAGNARQKMQELERGNDRIGIAGYTQRPWQVRA